MSEVILPSANLWSLYVGITCRKKCVAPVRMWATFSINGRFNQASTNTPSCRIDSSALVVLCKWICKWPLNNCQMKGRSQDPRTSNTVWCLQHVTFTEMLCTVFAELPLSLQSILVMSFYWWLLICFWCIINILLVFKLKHPQLYSTGPWKL